MKQMRSLKKQGGWLGAALGVASLVSNRKSSKSGQKANKRLIRENIALVELETAEELRRMDATFEQVQGETEARIAASGFTGEGTQEQFQAELETEFGRQRSFTQRAAKQRIEVIRRGGEADRAGIRAGERTAGFNALNTALSFYS